MKHAFSTFAPRAVWLAGVPMLTVLLQQGQAAPLASPQSAPVLISELRPGGPNGAADAFVELFNTGPQPISLAGWSLHCWNEKGAPVSLRLAPTARIAARGHLLLTGSAYSLQSLATGDLALLPRLNGGVALLDAKGQTIDAVGPQAAQPTQREGAGLPAWAFAPRPTLSAEKKALIPQFSLVRRAPDGQPQDSGDNAQDFAIVSVTGALSGQKTQIGAPGPENAASPPLRAILASEPPVPAGGGAQTQFIALQSDPNRNLMRRARREVGPLKTQGTMTLRYRFTNDSPDTLRSLSFRVNSLTCDPQTGENSLASDHLAPAGLADVRFVRGKAATTTSAKPGTAPDADAPEATEAAVGRAVAVWKAKLPLSPALPQGGGLNALLNVELPKNGIAPGARGEIWFLLGVERTGNYRVVLSNQRLNLVFEGNTEDDAVVTPGTGTGTVGGVGANGSQSTVSLNGNGSNNGQNGANGTGATGANAAGDGLGSEEAEGIHIFGNTEDGVPVAPPVVPSGPSS